eukprot:1463478-Rhodomonas_salina.1
MVLVQTKREKALTSALVSGVADLAGAEERGCEEASSVVATMNPVAAYQTSVLSKHTTHQYCCSTPDITADSEPS